MQAPTRETFTTVRTEGAILPPDLLRRIADGDRNLGGLRADDYHLPGERLNEAINRSWNRLVGAWTAFRDQLSHVPESDTATTLTRERWLLPLFQELGFGRLLAARAIELDGKSYPVSHVWGATPIHLVGAHVDLDRRTAGVAGAARSSPHSLVQELLNRSDEHLWAFVSNGLRLRILRDNASLTRDAYVEFDLEAMMAGEVYADFTLLWLVCHQSRVETSEAGSDDDGTSRLPWLERWSQAADKDGMRALDDLRRGVEAAITALGRGFLDHTANRVLRERLRSGALDKQDYYRQVLRLVYRLLFLFVAEDRDLLLDPRAGAEAKERYTRHYSTARLRQLAEKRKGTRHADRYVSLRVIMERLGSDQGYANLGLPALGSFLFSQEATPDLGGCEIANSHLLMAVHALALTTDGAVRRTVDYRNLNVEEMGSVYESLLELHPEVDAEASHFELRIAGGNERKTTGSYYTPDSLVRCLLNSALDPVLDEAARRPDAEAAILNLKVCDPACGSGHFLIAAARRIAKRLAAVRTGDDEPAPEALRHALRDVIGRCIYGVDVNPMAVELCKVALWMEALDPGRPLSFLDHRIQCGNSLLGTTPALLAGGIPDAAFEPIEGDDKAVCSEYRKKNRQFRAGQRSLFDEEFRPWDKLGNLAVAMSGMDDIADDTMAGVQQRRERWERLVRSADYEHGRLLADAWCAAFVWKKTRQRQTIKEETEGFSYPITEEVFRRIERNPYDIAPWMREEIRRLAEQYRFFHWHLAFPDVFHAPAKGTNPDYEQTGWSGGFDVVLGNPPWERIKLQEREWFAERRPEIANAPNAAQRRRMIDALAKDDPALRAAFLEDRRRAEGESHLVRNSGRYPLTGRGDINTYAVFAETNRHVINPTGRVGCILPPGIATDDTTKHYFRELMQTRSLASLFTFENEAHVFPGIDHRVNFALLTITGQARPEPTADFVFFARQTSHLQEMHRHFTLTSRDLTVLNPNTGTCPLFRSSRDAELTKAIYHRVPVLIREGVPEGNPWGMGFLAMFHMSNDSNMFYNREELVAAGWRLRGNAFWSGDARALPLYEAKMVHHFDVSVQVVAAGRSDGCG